MLLACRLFFLLKSGPGTATVAPPSMLLSMCPPMQPFAKLPVRQREAILQWWSVNPIPLMKKVRSGSSWLRSHASMRCRAPFRTSGPSPPCCKHLIQRGGQHSSCLSHWGRASPAALSSRHSACGERRCMGWQAEGSQGALHITSQVALSDMPSLEQCGSSSLSTAVIVVLPGLGGCEGCSTGPARLLYKCPMALGSRLSAVAAGHQG